MTITDPIRQMGIEFEFLEEVEPDVTLYSNIVYQDKPYDQAVVNYNTGTVSFYQSTEEKPVLKLAMKISLEPIT